MRNVELVFVSLIGCLFGHDSFGYHSDPIYQSGNSILPWIGILRVKSGTNHADAVTGLIMIKNQLAVGNANDIATVKIETLRKIAIAMFHKNSTWWSCAVTNYTLHPEYFKGVKNTIALVNFNCDTDDVYWNTVNWPTVNTRHDHVYSIGLTDSDQQLQQVTNRMEAVTNVDCDIFYKKEKLDYKSLQPSNNVCYKVLNTVNQCVIDAGMPLAVRSGNNWTLIGMSVFGPGCSLPSRFIQFLPYIPWISSKLVKTRENFRRSKYWYDQGMEEPYEDQDTYLLSKINKNSIVMRPSLAYLKEQVYGKCTIIDGVLMYREFGTIRAPTNTATAVYSISLYDLFFPHITCVFVTVMCDKRSQIRYWVSLGFHQEDIDDYVKIILAPKRDPTKPPKILYIKDTYKRYRGIGTANLEFKFEFTDEAKLDLEFYGRNISSPLRPPRLPFVPLQKQTSGHLPGGPEFNAREDEPEDSLDIDDSFYHF